MTEAEPTAPTRRIPRQHRPTKPTKATAPAKSKTDLAIEEAAQRLAANAPPLSEGQRRRIAELFASTVNALRH